MPVIFQEKTDRKLKLETPARQDFIIVGTKGNKRDHILEPLKNAGCRASLEKSKFFQKQMDWLSYKVSEKGIIPKNAKTEAIFVFEKPRKLKEIGSFLGSAQFLGKFIPNLTEKTEPKLLGKGKHKVDMNGEGTNGIRPNQKPNKEN